MLEMQVLFIHSEAETFTKGSILMLKEYDVVHIRIADIFSQTYNFTFEEAYFR